MSLRGSSVRVLTRRSTVFSVLLAAFLLTLGLFGAGCSLDDGRPVFVDLETNGDGGPPTIDGGPVLADGGSDASDGAPSDGGPTGVSVQVVGATTALTVQEKRDFAALVTGTTDTAVTWSVDPLDGGAAPDADAGDDGGTTTASTGAITAGGTYTAPATPGTYTVVATSHADNSVRGSASFAVVAAPVAAITAPTIASANATGLTASVTAQAGSTFVWTALGGTITAGAGTNAITFSAGASGAVALSVVVTNAAGTTATGSANVAIVSAPVVSISVPATVTAGKTGIVASVPSQTSATYAWTITGGTITSGTTSTSITFTAGAVGTITVGCTVTVAGSATSGSTSVAVVAAPSAAITTVSSTPTGTTGIDASVAAQTGSSFAWSISGGTIASGNGTRAVKYTATTAGTLVLTVTVTNAAGDSANASANVVVANAPSTPTISAPTNATAAATGLLASITPQNGATYAWTITNGTITSATNGSSIVFTAGSTGSLGLSVTVTNVVGSANASATVSVVAAPVVSITAPSSATAGQTGLAASVAAQTGATYSWTISNGTITAGATTHAITFTAGTAGTLGLSCTVTNSAGTSTSGSTTVSVVGTTAALTVTVTGGPSNAVVSIAGPSGYATTVNATQTLTGLAAGTYSVSAGNTISGGLTYVPTVSGSPVTIAAGGTGTASVSYASHDEAPTIGAIADQTIYVGGGTTVAITVGDAEDSASSLNVQSSITGTGLASAAVDGSGANRTVTLVPGSSAGTANVTVSVTDSKGTTTTKTFKVTTVAAVVTSTADSGAGTLRDVATNVDAGAVITFDPSLNGKTITLSSSVTLPTSVKLQGPGPNLVTIAIGFNGGWTWPSAATVQGLTFQGTSSSTYVYVPMNATATVSGCAFVESQLTAGESTALTVTNSSFTSSSTAIALLESSVDRLTNVTISGTGTGIEILASGVDVAIASSTITSATSIILYEGSGTVTLRNSVVSGEIVNGFGTHVVQSLDYNLLASTPDPGAYTLAAHDQSAVDPKLDPLANYGGTTSTYRLQSTSPAVDAVPNASCVDASGNALTTDQRGKARPSGAACDIGAFERQPDDG